MKILIGYDGSDQGDVIIKDLQKAGLPEDAKARVLTVADTWGLPVDVDGASPRPGKYVHPTSAVVEEHLKALAADSEKIAKAFALRISNSFPGWNVTGESILGKPAPGLIEMADKWPPDLLVVGSQGRSAIGRFFLGSVSQKVLYDARCSVRISRKARDESRDATRVMLGVDGSKSSERIVEIVGSRVWNETAEIRLIAVDDPFSHPESGYLPWAITEDKPVESDKSRDWMEKVLEAPSRILRSRGLNVSSVLRWGDAANVILNEAEEWDADSILLGARGLGRIKRLLLGSVSSKVAAKAGCSVEVIR